MVNGAESAPSRVNDRSAFCPLSVALASRRLFSPTPSPPFPPSANLASQRTRTLVTNHSPVATGFPTATADPRSIGILSDQRESKELSLSVTRKPNPTSDLKAKKNLTATFTKLKVESNHSKQRASHFSNRNKIDCFVICATKQRAGRMPTLRLSTRNRSKIEIVATHRKQRKASNSNRGYSRPARRSIWGCGGQGVPTRSCSSRITNHESQITVPMPPVIQSMTRTCHQPETPAGAAASKDLGVGKRGIE